MELFRVISPNGGSISTIRDARTSAHGAPPQQRFGLPLERHSYVSTPHTSTSLDPVHWKDPNAFDPQRYLGVPTSAQITEEKCRKSVLREGGWRGEDLNAELLIDLNLLLPCAVAHNTSTWARRIWEHRQ
jgi:hypothetical protein